ncbi:nuclear transport factor 2 family protein [Aquimarina agarilytica]|uniref:nuclear transport factor 2 family protein n=1 Tax=Aquimarina agarilytica TaxID=1087449 RepID=UPI00028882A3|nr:nuclear transport factor 2 family protein [Aquimarina agarilytica]
MKKIVLTTILLAILGLSSSYSQTANDAEAIKSVITAFAKAGDSNDSAALTNYIADDFRIVMNRQFGSNKVSIVPKSVYLKKIKTKEWGGDHRVLTFQDIIVNGISATAKVVSKGKKSTFNSIFVLIKDKKGTWKIISDVPVIS